MHFFFFLPNQMDRFNTAFCGYSFLFLCIDKNILTGTTENCSISRKPHSVIGNLHSRRQCLQTDVRTSSENFKAEPTHKEWNMASAKSFNWQACSIFTHKIEIMYQAIQHKTSKGFIIAFYFADYLLTDSFQPPGCLSEQNPLKF